MAASNLDVFEACHERLQHCARATRCTILTKVAFSQGTSTYVLVFYRNIIAAVVLLPVALAVERKTAPPLSLKVSLKLFVHALCGMESFKLKMCHGIVKISGIVFCAVGVSVLALYQGPDLKSFIKHHLFSHTNRVGTHSSRNWILGIFLQFLATLMWALWAVLQGPLLEEYPSKLLNTTLQIVFSAVQSFFMALVLERDFSRWKLGFDIGLVAIIYCGIVVSAISFYMQIWIIDKRGPVFLCMTVPLTLVITIILELLIGEAVTLGSIISGALMVVGLYTVLLGKRIEEEGISSQGGMQIVTKFAFNEGMSTSVFVFYRHVIAILFLVPVAFVLERKTAPPLTFKVISGAINIYSLGLSYASATSSSAIFNLLPAVAFILALLMKMESLNLKRINGIAKVSGVVLCIVGVIILAFYQGPELKSFNHHHLFRTSTVYAAATSHPATTWILGIFLTTLSTTCWALWTVLQGPMLEVYPSKLLNTTIQIVFATIQCFFIALAIERDFSRWKLHLDMGLIAVIYSGVLVSGVAYYMQVWVIDKSGPVFLAMTMPITLLVTIMLSSFVLGEAVTLGSIISGVVMVGGLYCVLWAKKSEQAAISKQQMGLLHAIKAVSPDCAQRIAGSVNIYGLGLSYSSATSSSAISNLLPVLAFFLAVLMGMESLNLKRIHGIAKVFGVLFSIVGVIILAFYQGPELKSLNLQHLSSRNVVPTGSTAYTTKAWTSGIFLTVLSTTSWALWTVLQGLMLEVYPSKLLNTTIQMVFATIQCFFIALAVERDFSRWKLGLDAGLIAVIYSGALVSGLAYYMQVWVIDKSGPVFLAMTMPITLIVTIVLSSFVLGEAVTLGSIISGVVMVGGLYCVLWAKKAEQAIASKEEATLPVQATQV
uniref:EamA domain-containing protein n=1 Tax=Oryza rufipogon TaxID=4529 RepID=A0A0E0MXS8_ORYRU